MLPWVRKSYLTHVILPRLSRVDCSLVVLEPTGMLVKRRHFYVKVTPSLYHVASLGTGVGYSEISKVGLVHVFIVQNFEFKYFRFFFSEK